MLSHIAGLFAYAKDWRRNELREGNIITAEYADYAENGWDFSDIKFRVVRVIRG
jgi:hypothetical protein